MPEDTGQTRWLELRITLPRPAQEAVSALLWELEVSGISEESAEPSAPDTLTLSAWLPDQDRAPLLARLRAQLAALEPDFPGAGQSRLEIAERLIEAHDWDADWREQLKPVRVSSRLVCRPRWEPYEPRPGEVVLDLEPGDAFGTGTHETTRGCLKAVDALFGGDDAPVRPLEGPIDLLDVGTGTGVLLVAALKLGAERGVGIDIDPMAVAAARENCVLNGVGDRVEISSQPIEAISGRFRLVLVNILAPLLVDLAPVIAARVHLEGALVLSGMALEQVPWVEQAYAREGMGLEAAIEEGGWATLVLRPGAG